RIEAKGTLAYQWGERINEGMPYSEAIAGIGPDLSDQGVFMRPNVDVIRSASYSAADYSRFVLRAAERNVSPIVNSVVASPAWGSPFALALLVLGVFGKPWSRDRAQIEGLLVVYVACCIAVLLTVQELWFRYFYPLFGLLLYWVAVGADELGEWTASSVRAVV